MLFRYCASRNRFIDLRAPSSENSIPSGISLLEADEYGAEVVARVAVACSPRYHVSIKFPYLEILHEKWI